MLRQLISDNRKLVAKTNVNPIATCIQSDTIGRMYTIKTLKEFDEWLDSLKDNVTRLRLARRLEKASRGNLGDVKSVGDGVYEMREFFGSGWRMYYVQHGDQIIVMLGGGDKSSQQKEIETAKSRAHLLED